MGDAEIIRKGWFQVGIAYILVKLVVVVPERLQLVNGGLRG